MPHITKNKKKIQSLCLCCFENTDMTVCSLSLSLDHLLILSAHKMFIKFSLGCNKNNYLTSTWHNHQYESYCCPLKSMTVLLFEFSCNFLYSWINATWRRHYVDSTMCFQWNMITLQSFSLCLLGKSTFFCLFCQ